MIHVNPLNTDSFLGPFGVRRTVSVIPSVSLGQFPWSLRWPSDSFRGTFGVRRTVSVIPLVSIGQFPWSLRCPSDSFRDPFGVRQTVSVIPSVSVGQFPWSLRCLINRVRQFKHTTACNWGHFFTKIYTKLTKTTVLYHNPFCLPAKKKTFTELFKPGTSIFKWNDWCQWNTILISF